MITIILACFVGLLWIILNNKGKSLPPGPWGLPILGYVFVNPFDPLKTLNSLARKYGSVFSFKIGMRNVVFINDFKVLRKAYGMSEFGGRMDNEINCSVTFNKPIGLVNSSMARSVHHRRFVLKHFKDFGVGKKDFDPIMAKYVSRIVERLRRNKNDPKIKLEFFLETSVISILWNIMLGGDFKMDDVLLQMYLKSMLKVVEDYWKIFFVSSLHPVLRKIIPKSWYTLDKFQKSNEMFKLYSATVCESLKQNVDKLDPEVFTDHYLMEMLDAESKGLLTDFSDEDLVCCLTDLFVAGIETTSETIRYAVLYLIRNPDWQRKLQKEVDDNIGRSRPPGTEDRTRMPITQAFLHETLRYSTFTPLGIYHMAETDVYLNDYYIPKDAIVLGHLEYIHFDPLVFDDPKRFNPGRFLDDEGKFIKHPGVLPFLSGKRKCIGEHLANIELFVILSSLVQNFTFKPSPGEAIPSDRRVVGQIAKPYPYTFSIEDRFASEEVQSQCSVA